MHRSDKLKVQQERVYLNVKFHDPRAKVLVLGHGHKLKMQYLDLLPFLYILGHELDKLRIK